MANGTIAVSGIAMLTTSGTGVLSVVPPATNTNRTLTLPDSTGTIATAESTLAQFNASGSAPVYACRAWVNFNGIGTVAIRASGNVSSITDNGTGDYTVNFTTAMPDVNYSAVNQVSRGGNNSVQFGAFTYATTSFRMSTAFNQSGTSVDCDQVNVSIFR